MKVDLANLPGKKKPDRVLLVLYILTGFLILLGAGAIGYPYLADYVNNLHTSRMYAEYMESVRDLNPKEAEAMLDAARIWNEELESNHARFSDSGVDRDRYLAILDTTGTGILGYVEIPKINVRLPVYHTTDEGVLQIAVGHMEGTSFPIGMTGAHAVLSGHNGLISSSIFTELSKLETEDRFFVNVLGNKLEYEVAEINVVLPDNFKHFDLEPGRDLVTLMTCTPFGVNSHRLLVKGERIDYSRPENRIRIRF